jgi:hypothetical protein
MTRSVSFFLIATLLGAACSKDPPPRAESSAPPTETKAATAAHKTATPPPEPPERVSKTGVLDLELAAAGKRYTVRNAILEVTFPARPTVQSQQDRFPDGGMVTSGLAIANHGAEQLGFVVTPMPKDKPYDPEVGINGARDGAIKNVGAKLEREVETTLGGLAGKRITATVKQGRQTIYLEMHIAWDAAHHQLIYAFTASPTATPSKGARDFVTSLRIKADAAPADPEPATQQPS